VQLEAEDAQVEQFMTQESQFKFDELANVPAGHRDAFTQVKLV
jgi:hypothetical protein